MKPFACVPVLRVSRALEVALQAAEAMMPQAWLMQSQPTEDLRYFVDELRKRARE